MNLPECCKNCYNRPKEGEFKVCCCTLPSLGIISNITNNNTSIYYNINNESFTNDEIRFIEELIQ